MNHGLFELAGPLRDVEVVAVVSPIRDLPRLRNLRLAELHWYEAHGIGKKEIKIKRFLD